MVTRSDHGLDKPNQALKVYVSGTTIYVCKGEIGSALTSAVWQIQRFETTDITRKWADGDDLADNTATDLATVAGHSYS